MRDSIVFYKGFYQGLEALADDQRGRVYSAIMAYAMDDIEPELDGIEMGFFEMMRGQIDANNKKYNDGQKGGRPKKETSGFENEKPVVLEKDENKKPNVNENVNVNVNKKKNSKKEKPPKNVYGFHSHILLTDDEYKKLCNDFSPAEANSAIAFLDDYMEEKPKYKTESHYLTIRRWVMDAVNERKARGKPKENAFHNLEKQQYDFDALEKQLLGG